MYSKSFVVIIIVTILYLVEIKCKKRNKEHYYRSEGPNDLQNIYDTESSDIFNNNEEETDDDDDDDYDYVDDDDYDDDDDDDYDYVGDDDYDYEPINFPKVNNKKKNKNKKSVIKQSGLKTKYSSSEKNKPNFELKKLTETKEENTEVEELISDFNKKVSISDNQGEVCSLKLNQDISKKNEPLFLVKDTRGKFHLDLPKLIKKDSDKYNSGTDAIQFNKEDTIYVECPGKLNKVNVGKLNDNASTEMKCITGSRVSLHAGKVNEILDSSQLICLRPVTGTARFSAGKQSCGNNEGVLIELGFSVKGWHKLIDICFNVKEIKTVYAKHKLYGSILAGAVVDSNRPKFNRGQDDFYPGINPDGFYKQVNQNETIFELTGDETYFKPDSNLYLARGHFAPDADFIFKTWQDLSYFFVNVAPQWQSINQGHWLSVERLTRNIAMKLGEDLDVITGPFGVMELAGKKLYLKLDDKNKRRKRKNKESIPELAVPNHYWKLIHRPVTNECIVLISTNNPFLDDDSDQFCSDLCEEYSWPKLKDAKKGFVSCCSYEDFKKTVSTVPDYDCSGGIIKGP